MDLVARIRKMREDRRKIDCLSKGLPFVPVSSEFLKSSDEINHKLTLAQIEEFGHITNKDLIRRP